jgi:hypothetical protein
MVSMTDFPYLRIGYLLLIPVCVAAAFWYFLLREGHFGILDVLLSVAGVAAVGLIVAMAIRSAVRDK